jgi:hypothetical protein
MATALPVRLATPDRRIPTIDSLRPVAARFLDGAAAIDADLTGLIAASLVELASGRTVAATRSRLDRDIVAAGAGHGAVLRHKLRLVRLLSPGTRLNDVLFLSTQQIHLLRLMPPSFFIYVIADATLTHPAAVRTVVSRHLGNLA